MDYILSILSDNILVIILLIAWIIYKNKDSITSPKYKIGDIILIGNNVSEINTKKECIITQAVIVGAFKDNIGWMYFMSQGGIGINNNALREDEIGKKIGKTSMPILINSDDLHNLMIKDYNDLIGDSLTK